MKRALLLTALLSLSAFAQKSLTLEQVMSAPFSEELVRAKSAPRVAWVTNIRGVRNIYFADAPDYKPRQITHYDKDDGQPIAALAISPDGKTLVYARGSEVNAASRAANPESLPEQPKQQVFSLHPDDANARPALLGDMGCEEEGCEDIQSSWDNKYVVWEANQQIFIAPENYLAPDSPGGKPPAAKLTDIRGSLSEFAWSPDSRHLAFRVDRKDHSLIAIADIDESGGSPKLSAVRYLSPSADRDQLPRWSADGKHIAFIRTPGAETRVPLIPLRAVPWSIYVADTQTTQALLIWHSGTASRDSLPSFEDVGFHFAGDRVTFVSEHDNWPHLYSIPANGGQPTLLTPGDFSIEDVILSNDEKSLIYTSNQGNLDSRHVWRVPVAGGNPTQLSSGNGFEFHPLEVSNGDLLTLGSTSQSASAPYKLASTKPQALATDLTPREFPSQQLLTPKLVTFPSTNSLTIHGQLFMPPQCAQTKCPALIFTHGGPPRQMFPGFSYMYYYSNAYQANQYLASHGYIVLSVNYRLGIMYGHDFQYPPDGGWRGASEYNDVLAGAHYLQSLPNVDTSRIGLWGGSYGGFLTAMGLARNSDIFKAGVDFHGVHDWSVLLEQRGRLADSSPDYENAMQLAIKSSPVGSMSGWRSPVLLIHGDDDRNVPFSQTTDLAQRLKHQNVHYEELIMPDEIHDLLRWNDWKRSYQAMADFFDRELKTGSK
ncbi:MAG: hypothetical protein NVS9B15_14380 [Acidobacteriaceae bacterium]